MNRDKYFLVFMIIFIGTGIGCFLTGLIPPPKEPDYSGRINFLERVWAQFVQGWNAY